MDYGFKKMMEKIIPMIIIKTNKCKSKNNLIKNLLKSNY